jgi:hypothetical protein
MFEFELGFARWGGTRNARRAHGLRRIALLLQRAVRYELPLRQKN